MLGAQALVVAVVAVLLATASAHAASGPPDPDAPPGASSQWLPQEDWVMQRWLPFDEARLYRALDTTRPAVDAWLDDDNGRRSLEQLARGRGMSRKALVARLLGPRRRGVTPRQYKRLRDRTARVVTQSHLSQHILFHTFHQWAVREAARRTLGLSDREWRRLRGRSRSGRPGLTVVQIARRRGVPVKRLRRPVMAAVARSYRRGKRAGAISARQVRRQMKVHYWKIQFWPWDPEAPDGRADRIAPRADRTAHFRCDL